MSKQTPEQKSRPRHKHSGREHAIDAAEVAMHHGVEDDPLVRAVKRAGGWMQENWRIAVVAFSLVVLLVIVVVWNLANSQDRHRRAWERFHDATSIADLEELVISQAEYETLPHIYLRLVEWTAAGKDASLTPEQRDRKLFERINHFLDKYGANPAFKAEAERLTQMKAVVSANIDAWKAAKSSSDKVPEQPQATEVIQPELDESTGRYRPFANPVVAFETRYGRVRVELFADEAPNTVANFMHLVAAGFYNLDGPGGIIQRAGTDANPGLLTIGEFPATAPSVRTRKYNDLKDSEPRVKRLDAKWSGRFNARSLDYTIPFEASGAKRTVTAGSLVMKLARLQGEFGAPQPDSASFAFHITAAPAPQWDHKYVVFGRVLDTAEHDSSQILRRLGEQTDIQLAWVERVRPQMRDRTIVRQTASGGRESVAPDFVQRNDLGYLVPAADASNAAWLALYPGQAEQVPAGQQYQAPAGVVNGTRFPTWGDVLTADADKPAIVSYFAADATVARNRAARLRAPMTGFGSATVASAIGGLGSRTSVLLLPTRAPVLQDGKPVANTYTPRVKYTGWPNLVEARAVHAPPGPLKPLELFGPRPGAPPPGAPGMPGGGQPFGIDPRTGQPILPGNPGGGPGIPGLPGSGN